ncbi:hypothetical protein M231_00693 [Tremella mesenterica]|uniref:ABM domain-containing protein n=1 Tax=Tremella mesenterica TaxID=5217 RepID=A0A4Q1BVB4_TREME|nr:hypothetical protein M231_00693 [Tremella mesenterica]
MSVFSLATIIARPSHEASVREALIKVNKKVKETEKGTIQYQLTEDTDKAGVFYMWEEYVDQSAYEDHVNSEAVKSFQEETRDKLDVKLIMMKGCRTELSEDETSEDGSTTSSKSKSEIPEYDDENADLILVSSDETRFKVHSYYLKAASVIFRNMLQNPDSMAQSGERPMIHLTDSTIETANILRAALDVLYGKQFPDDHRKYHARLLKVIRFLQKYECEGSIDKIRLLLHRWITSPDTSAAWSAFIVSAALDDIVTCSRAIRRAGNWGIRATDEKQGSRDSSSVFDLGNLSLEQFSQIPVPMLWAILRATKSQRTLPQKNDGWSKVASRFCELLGVEGKC